MFLVGCGVIYPLRWFICKIQLIDDEGRRPVVHFEREGESETGISPDRLESQPGFEVSIAVVDEGETGTWPSIPNSDAP